MIYKECIKTQTMIPGHCGYIHTCRTIDPIDRCCSCHSQICPHIGSKCQAKAALYLSNPTGLLAVNRQTRSKSSMLYAHAKAIHIDLTHIGEFLYNGLTNSDLRNLLENEARIHVTLDLRKLLLEPRGSLEKILMTWAHQRVEDTSPSRHLRISFHIVPHQEVLVHEMRHAPVTRTGVDLLRWLMRLPCQKHPHDMAHEILDTVYGDQRRDWSQSLYTRERKWLGCFGEVQALLTAVDLALIDRLNDNQFKAVLGLAFDLVPLLAMAAALYWKPSPMTSAISLLLSGLMCGSIVSSELHQRR